MIALAICEIGSLAERRIAMLVDPALSGLPAFLTPQPGLNSGFMIPQVTAAALVSENKQRAYPASVDSIPTSANQEDHVSMAAHGARRLAPMARNAARWSRSRRSPRRRAAISTRRCCRARRSRPCARAMRARGAASRRRPLFSRRHRRRGAAGAVRRPRRGGGRRYCLRSRSGAMTSTRLAARRAPRGAADRQHPARRASTSSDSSRASSVAWLARTRRRLAYRRALRLRARSARPSCARRFRARSSTSTAIPAAPRSIPGRRRRNSARRRPSTASRFIARARRPTRRRSPSAARALFRALSCGAPRRDRAPARRASARRALRRAFDPLASFRACSTANCRSSISARIPARAATRRCASASAASSPRAGEPCRRRALQGRLDHAQLRPAGGGRRGRADGTRLPRLHAWNPSARSSRTNWPTPLDEALRRADARDADAC